MVRILQIFYGMDCGGAENMIMNLYRKIDRTKVQFDFVVHTEKKCFFDDEISALGGRIYHAPEYKVVNHFYYKKWWDAFFKNHKEYKIIHGHMYSIAPIYLKIAKNYGLMTIIHSHNTAEQFNIKELIKSCLRLKAGDSADYLFACSEAAGKWLYGKTFLQAENHYVLNNAICAEKFVYDKNVRDEIRKEFGIEDKFVIGHVGRFNEQKNHRFLIEIFKSIYKKRENAVLILVGGGYLEEEIRKKIESLGLLDKVIFAGVRPDINKLLQAADCFVFPSLYEGLPVTVIEAQAAGLPCFISDSITSEVCITDLIEMISINETSDYWSSIILNKVDSIISREETKHKIIDAGYDIASTAEWLEAFYMEIGC